MNNTWKSVWFKNNSILDCGNLSHDQYVRKYFANMRVDPWLNTDPIQAAVLQDWIKISYINNIFLIECKDLNQISLIKIFLKQININKIYKILIQVKDLIYTEADDSIKNNFKELL